MHVHLSEREVPSPRFQVTRYETGEHHKLGRSGWSAWDRWLPGVAIPLSMTREQAEAWVDCLTRLDPDVRVPTWSLHRGDRVFLDDRRAYPYLPRGEWVTLTTHDIPVQEADILAVTAATRRYQLFFEHDPGCACGVFRCAFSFPADRLWRVRRGVY